MTTNAELVASVGPVLDLCQMEVFIARQLITREDWDRALGEDVIRLHGVFRELIPDLAQILENSRVVMVGEPGIGKTFLALRAALVFVALSSYRGNLAGTLASASSGITQIGEIESDPIRRACAKPNNCSMN